MEHKDIYIFIDDNIYFQGQKLPPKKIQLFQVSMHGNIVTGVDEFGNEYTLDRSKIIKVNSKGDNK